MSHCSQNTGGCSFLGPSSCSQNTKKDCGSDVLDNPRYRLPAASSGLGNLNPSTERTGQCLEVRKMLLSSFCISSAAPLAAPTQIVCVTAI